MSKKEFAENQIVVYVCGNRFEIGKIKRLCDDGCSAFVWYHSGDTASKTPLMCLHAIENAYCIESTSLGGCEE